MHDPRSVGPTPASVGSQWLVRLLIAVVLIAMIALAFLAATAALVVAIILVPVVLVWSWVRRVLGRAPAVQGARQRAADGARFVEPFFQTGGSDGGVPPPGDQDGDDVSRRNVRVRR